MSRGARRAWQPAHRDSRVSAWMAAFQLWSSRGHVGRTPDAPGSSGRVARGCGCKACHKPSRSPDIQRPGVTNGSPSKSPDGRHGALVRSDLRPCALVRRPSPRPRAPIPPYEGPRAPAEGRWPSSRGRRNGQGRHLPPSTTTPTPTWTEVSVV